MARFKEVKLKRQGCVSLVSRMYPDDTLFDYVVYVNVDGKSYSYVFADVIIAEYEAIKSKFDEKFQSDFERRKDIFNEILISKSYLLPDKWKNTVFECGGNASRRKQLIFLADMFEEGDLSESDFKSIASVLPYGKKYVKFILEQQLNIRN